MSDPPDHTRLRALVSKAFTTSMVEGMRSRVQQIVDGVLDEVESKGEMDLIRDFASRLPVIVISEMLGVSPEDRARFISWTEDMMAFLGGGGPALPRVAEQAQNSLFEMCHYFRAIIADRRRRAQGDLISGLIKVEEAGNMLSEEQVLGMCDQLLIDGNDTIRNLIGNGMLALLQNPDQLKKLLADPSLIRSAVEEFLRFEAPAQRLTRVALEDLELGGRQIRKGQAVLVMLGAANHDPAQFADPDRLDIGRRENSHVAFGVGIHSCLGASLVRLEGQIAINAILQRLPSIKLADDGWE